MRKLALTGMLLYITSVATFGATYSGTLTASNGPASISWSGGPLTGTLGYEGLVGIGPTCTSTICDFYNLTVNLPSTFYSANPGFAVHVTLSWGTNLQDIDLYVYDAKGDLVGYSANGATTSEDADLGQLPSGNYQIQVVPSSSVALTYTGAASVGPEPAVNVGKAAYRLGNFSFTSQVLARPPQAVNSTGTPLFYEQDAEPRVVHDAVGNIYVAAIQGIPAGTDVWKSMDGGNTFTYEGEPDGAQAAAATGGLDGVGIGGGDEDVVFGSTGNLYLTSLWLGNATNCVSSDGAATFLCDAWGSPIPEDDRQWLAADGPNVVYFTTKQLGTLDNATPSIYAAKSLDGGQDLSFGHRGHEAGAWGSARRSRQHHRRPEHA